MNPPGPMVSPLLALSGPQVVEVCVAPLAAAVALGFLLGLPTRWLGSGFLRSALRFASAVPPVLAAAGFLGIVGFNLWADGVGSLAKNAPEFLVLAAGAAVALWTALRLWKAAASPASPGRSVSSTTSAPNTGIP